jgi:alpha-glucosidase
MTDVMRFWLDRGVDGFRIDVLWHIVKAEGLPDNPANPDWREGWADKLRLLQHHSTDQPEAHVFARSFRELADSYGETLLVGEIFLPRDRLMRWYGEAAAPGVHLPFNFELIENAWERDTLAALIADYDAGIPEHGWPNWVIGSHDAPRIAARVGEAQARVAAMLLLTLRGTPTIYQGDEIGIGKVDIPPDRIRDPQDLRQPGMGLGRDRSRTPMSWDASRHAGFSTAEPWLPLNSDWQTRNVAAQEDDPRSMLALYRKLLAARRHHPALSLGSMTVHPGERGVLAYERQYGDQRLFVALNLSGERHRVMLPEGTNAGAIIVATGERVAFDGVIGPDEGFVVELEI